MTRTSDSAGLTRREWMRLLGVGAGLAAVSVPEGSEATLQTASVRRSTTLAGMAEGAIIRTVLKDVPPEAVMGAVLFHEHLSTATFRAKRPRPKNFREDVDLISEEVSAAREAGISLIVDASLREMGRNVEMQKDIQRRTGVLVVGCGGHMTEETYPPEIDHISEDHLLEELIRDLTSAHLGAFGEVGTSTQITPIERKVLRAIGRAQVRTGVAIIGHTDNGKGAAQTALEQLDIYESVGVKPDRVVIGHLDGFDDPELHAAVAKRGAYVGFDRVNSGTPDRDDMRVRNVLKFLDAGYVNQLLLASDFANEKLVKRNGGPGYAMTLTMFVPKLRAAGVAEEVLRQVMYDNPRRLLAFVAQTA